MAARMVLTTGEWPGAVTGSGLPALVLVQHLASLMLQSLEVPFSTLKLCNEIKQGSCCYHFCLLQVSEKQLGRDLWRAGVL